MTFQDFFKRATRSRHRREGDVPFPYQERFAQADLLPHLVRAPTGAGKTATAVLGWLWRLCHSGKPTPRRLVYCLPMRVLVEQSEREASRWIENLGLAQQVKVNVLMGGIEADDWHLCPERPTVLIGTQDMLLSRALNRGYAASRFHWPIDFGLLSNDCLWVFDEPQLMASGVSTSAQLAGLRQTLGTFGECSSVWMSATLEPSWLDTIDFRGKFTGDPLELDEEDYDPQRALYARMTAEKSLGKLGVSPSKDIKDVAKAILENHVPGTQTLVVLNIVERAKAVYAALEKLRKKSQTLKLLLVHSRFRPYERCQLNEQLQKKGGEAVDRIIVATQVVEAGVDISSRTLITELAPWASIVQRIGRCNRAGDDGPSRVFWIDLDENLSLPYPVSALDFARAHLTKLEGQSVSPKALDDYKRANEKPDEPFLPFEHKHVLRRRDLLDLFDTSPDLSGNDIDIQRFVRGDDEGADVQLFWRTDPPSDKWSASERRRHAPRRDELCNVPIGSFRKEFLEAGKTAFRFDYIDGKWQKLSKKDSGSVIPGETFWVTVDQGGYDRLTGWSPASPLAEEIPLPDEPRKSRRQRPEGFYDSDEWAAQLEWRTLAEHTDEVVSALNSILGTDSSVPLTGTERVALAVAARWHDWGKVHAIFQSGLRQEIDDPKQLCQAAPPPPDKRTKKPRPERWTTCTDIAKAPQEFWRKYTRLLRAGNSDLGEIRLTAKRFRHELATALGVMQLICNGRVPPDWARLSAEQQHLALYLIAAHHGKVRLAIRAMPDERPTPNDPETLFASGIWDGDTLPAGDLGGNVHTEGVALSLKPMQLGDDASWTGMALGLLKWLGPFKLAYLEAILRAADCRASGELDSRSDNDE
jgi:CRISPR-associated endonuclease/helicase Cas3